MKRCAFSLHVIFFFTTSCMCLGNEVKKCQFLLYDVNYGEGFNLRRDVYVRFSNLVRFLNRRQSDVTWTLVLPPWGRLYHWFNNRSLDRVPWSTFFDVPSLNLFVPAIEFQQFLNDTGGAPIDRVFYLQSMPFDGSWLERVELRPCEGSHSYHYSKSRELWSGWMYGYTHQPIREFACLSVQAEAKTLVDFVLRLPPASSIMFDRGETIIHGSYSEWSTEWWTARRSMVFSRRLRKLAADFRRVWLNSTDEADRTVQPDDWRRMQRPEGWALGGPYLAVHMRRRDFIRAHPDETPAPASAATALRRLAESLGLGAVFLATDDPVAAAAELAPLLHPLRLVLYSPTVPLTDGELAVLDQILCAHARHFVGTRSSTFTFRVVEERSLLGFARNSSVGVLCPDGSVGGPSGGGNCQAGTYWPPQFEPQFTLLAHGDGSDVDRQEL